jgi:PEGA domain
VQAVRPAETPIDEIDLRASEAARYEDVDGAPSEAPFVSAPSGLLQADAGGVTLERTRFSLSLVAMAVALIVGVAIGFAAGYLAGRQTAAPPAAPVAAAAPSGKEYTESPVKEDIRLKADSTNATPPATPQPAKAATGPGRLLVRSTPAGARVLVDGEERGVTPAAIRGLARGVHRVRVERDGYTAQDRRVVITRPRPAQTLAVDLARSSAARRPAAVEPGVGAGSLVVDSRPAGASVFVDGRLAGRTPLTMARISAGEHAVRLERDGYRTWSSITQISDGERTRVAASLDR